MNVTLTPEMADFVKEQIEGGSYDSPGEVLDQALQLLKEQAEVKRMRLESLRRDIKIGVDEEQRGEIALLDIEAIKAEGRKIQIESQAH